MEREELLGKRIRQLNIEESFSRKERAKPLTKVQRKMIYWYSENVRMQRMMNFMASNARVNRIISGITDNWRSWRNYEPSDKRTKYFDDKLEEYKYNFKTENQFQKEILDVLRDVFCKMDFELLMRERQPRNDCSQFDNYTLSQIVNGKEAGEVSKEDAVTIWIGSWTFLPDKGLRDAVEEEKIVTRMIENQHAIHHFNDKTERKFIRNLRKFTLENPTSDFLKASAILHIANEMNGFLTRDIFQKLRLEYDERRFGENKENFNIFDDEDT